MVFITAAAVTAGAIIIAKKCQDRSDAECRKTAAQPSEQERKLTQILSMLIDATYIRDGARCLNKLHNPNPHVAHESQYWTRMENCGVSEEEEKKCGIAHYVRERRHPEPGVAPMLVITSRGTIPYHAQDLADDIRVWLHILHTSPRYQESEKLIVKLAKHYRATYGGDDPSDIFVAGHSLGADIVLMAGMRLAEERLKVSLCCFNCPLLTAFSFTETTFRINKLKDMLWSVKETLGAMNDTMNSITDMPLKLNDYIKLGCAYLSDSEVLIKQLNRFKALQIGPVLMCINENDSICKAFFKFYKRNHRKGRTHLSSQALLSKFALDVEPEYFRTPRSVTMFLSKELSKPHSLEQWYSPDTKMEKREFNLSSS